MGGARKIDGATGSTLKILLKLGAFGRMMGAQSKNLLPSRWSISMPAHLSRIASTLFFASILTTSATIYAQIGTESGAAGAPSTAKVAPVNTSSRAVSTPTTQAAKEPAAPYESDPHFIAAMAEGKRLSRTSDLFFAVDAYKKANKIAGGKCAACLDQMITLDRKMGSYKDAAETAAELAAIAKTPVDKSIAEALRGEALYSQAGDKPKPAQLQAMDAVLKAALADYPKNLSARFIDGTVLARMGQMDAARQQFEACVAQASPNDPSYIRAKHFAENPAMSYAKMAPAFTVTALDGSKFTLDEMGGRVVLIDFWATWCGPCNEELPHIKKIAKELAGQPFVIISVSWDSDATKWKDFIAKNEMSWVQYRDANHELSKSFGIDAIPHYFTIDSDGVLTAELLGSGSDVEGKLKKLVARAKAAQVSTAAPATASATSATAN